MLLDPLLVVIRLFQFVFFLLKLITWPVRALIRSAARQHKATLERQQYDAQLAHYEVARAAKQAFEREQAGHRAAGEYVPYLDYHEITGICQRVAEVYGYAYEAYRCGTPAGPLMTALDGIRARFGPMTSAVFGVNPRSVIHLSDDYYNWLAASALFFIISNNPHYLKIVSGDDGSPTIEGYAGCEWLGVFSRATGVEPSLKFSNKLGHKSYDHYYIARNFTPDQASAEAHCRYWHEWQERRERQARSSDPFEGFYDPKMGSPGISGTFGPRLTWLAEQIFRHRQGT